MAAGNCPSALICIEEAASLDDSAGASLQATAHRSHAGEAAKVPRMPVQSRQIQIMICGVCMEILKCGCDSSRIILKRERRVLHVSMQAQT